MATPPATPTTTVSTFGYAATGLSLEISAYDACNTGQPMAFAAYTTSTSNSTVQLCAGNNTVTPGLVVTWDGSTTQSSTGFTVIYNGTPIPFVGLGTGAVVACSTLANSGNYTVCPAPSTPPTPPSPPATSSSGLKWWEIALIIGGIILFLLLVGLLLYFLLRKKKPVATQTTVTTTTGTKTGTVTPVVTH